ncbi:MAG: hypothetical protein ABIK64_09160, partial [Bacillota bacterium]
MSKRILLVSHCFAPQNKIGAVRPTKLAKYLLRMGYEVTVLCGKDLSTVIDPLLMRDLDQLTDVHVVREKSLLRWWKERSQPAPADSHPVKKREGAEKAHPLMNALYLYLADRADAAFGRACIREAKRMGRTFDVVLSTYGPPSVHTVARKVKRLGLAKRWIAD